jgi:hypothetical protein
MYPEFSNGVQCNEEDGLPLDPLPRNEASANSSEKIRGTAQSRYIPSTAATASILSKPLHSRTSTVNTAKISCATGEDFQSPLLATTTSIRGDLSSAAPKSIRSVTASRSNHQSSRNDDLHRNLHRHSSHLLDRGIHSTWNADDHNGDRLGLNIMAQPKPMATTKEDNSKNPNGLAGESSGRLSSSTAGTALLHSFSSKLSTKMMSSTKMMENFRDDETFRAKFNGDMNSSGTKIDRNDDDKLAAGDFGDDNSVLGAHPLSGILSAEALFDGVDKNTCKLLQDK